MANIDVSVQEIKTSPVATTEVKDTAMDYIKYLTVGILFGIVFLKAEIISWYRIQEMFRLQSFHMYGVIGSAIAVGMLSVFLIKKYKVKSFNGQEIKFTDKVFNKGDRKSVV